MSSGGLWRTLANRLDIRPGESRNVLLSSLAAFFMLAYLILAKSLREGIYLTTFDVKTLPYIMAAVVVLSIPTVSLFARQLERFNTRKLLMSIMVAQSVCLSLFWITWNLLPDHQRLLVIIFYLFTTIGTLILTSGFWIATSEQYGIRDAKRLYGLIGAGGTAGAMVMGSSISGLLSWLSLPKLVPGMSILLMLMLIAFWLLPAPKESRRQSAEPKSRTLPLGNTIKLIRRSRHLSLISLIIVVTVIMATLVDFQFKEIASRSFEDNERLTGFFGAFYGWMGGLALLVQLLLSARIIGGAGIARSLSLMPSMVLLGTIIFLIWPGLGAILIVRGTDESLRKSLHRQLIELLFVPIPAGLRRQTKAMIDSVVDSGGQGIGALIIFLTVTMAGISSQFLSILVIGFAILFLLLNRMMGRAYLKTTVSRLQEGEADVEQLVVDANLHERNLLTASFTRMDLQAIVGDISLKRRENTESMASMPDLPPSTMVEEIKSADSKRALVALITLCGQGAVRELTEEELTALVRSLARDRLYNQAVDLISALGQRVVPHLTEMLLENDGDFVIRRRIPGVLARIDTAEAEDALLSALAANRFEIRFRAGIALVHRRKVGLPRSGRDWRSVIWSTIRAEVSRDKPIWELQRLLDSIDMLKDEFVSDRVGMRGELSLEHTFRMLTLVCEPESIRAAYHGIILADENLNSYALEYLEQVLPVDIKQRLWLFIGDVSEHQRDRQIRSLNNVVGDLMATRATLFAGQEEREALMRLLREQARDDP